MKKLLNWVLVFAVVFVTTFSITNAVPVYAAEDTSASAEKTPIERLFSDDNMERLSGRDKYLTGIEVADALKVALDITEFENIVIACGSNYPDALSGSYLAKAKNAPVLLVSDSFLTMTEAALYVRSNLSSDGKVYILGGEGAVSKDFENLLVGCDVVRLSGASRYETNLEILKEAGVNEEEILVCTGKGYADSLSASAVGKPILLVDKNGLSAAQKEYLATVKTSKYYVIGGPGAVSGAIETELKTYGDTVRISGKNRYYTSIEVIKTFFDKSTENVVLVSGEEFADGLTAAPLALAIKAPTLLTSNDFTINKITSDYTKNELHAEKALVVGGNARISDYTAKKHLSVQEHTWEDVYETVDNGEYETVLVEETYWYCDECEKDITGKVGYHFHTGKTETDYRKTKTVEVQKWVPKLEEEVLHRKCSTCGEIDGHEHQMTKHTAKIESGRACNVCYANVTDAEDPYMCHGAWHTHQWCTSPEYSVCEECGRKEHAHTWKWIKPVYDTSADKVTSRGYYFCYGCYNFSSDGKTIDNSIQEECNTTVSYYDFTLNGGYIESVAHTDPMTDAVELQSIALDSQILSLAVEETYDFGIVYTPSNATSDRTITWESSDDTVLTVDESGVVTAVGVGAATITAKSALGHTAKCFVRVFDTNVGVVKSAVITIDGKEVTDKIEITHDGREHSVSLKTDPEQALYNVQYSLDGFSVAYMTDSSSKGDISENSWKTGVEFTDPSSAFKTLKAGTVTLKAKIVDVNQNVTEKTITIVVGEAAAEKPDDGETEDTQLGVPTIKEARFYHAGIITSLRNRLQISWDAVENADRYEIEVVKADGTTKTYTAKTAILLEMNAECPKVYMKDTSTWTAATVRVRAIAEDETGDWSDAVEIGCDMTH